jgi:group II intron reverse transcriptase/maturase
MALPDVSGRRRERLLKRKAKRREATATLFQDPIPKPNEFLEAVATLSNLEAALKKVVQNKGAPGVDRQCVEEVDREKDRILPKLRRALLDQTYLPGDIRRVWIPKPNGGRRGLGIPNVIDRWVQQAVLQILEPVFEPHFHPSSHGFRPARGAQTAIVEAMRYVQEGYRYVVDMDLEKFFDRVHHQRLLARLSQKVQDRRLLRLIRFMLKAKVVLPNGTKVSNEEGTPQGGPLSPLLANIVLDELDRELTRRGHRFVRYADDTQIFVRSERAGNRVLASIRRFLNSRLRLKVNEKKSAVAPSEKRHILGFRIGLNRAGKPMILISLRTRERLRQRIRGLTPRNWGQSITDCIERMNQYLQGWMGYFRICTKEVSFFLRLSDSLARRRIRAILLKQKKKARAVYRDLRNRNVGHQWAWATAYSRRGIWYRSASPGMNHAYKLSWFDERLVNLERLWKVSDGLPGLPRWIGDKPQQRPRKG